MKKKKIKIKMTSKKISSEIGIGIILLISILIGGAFYLQSKKEQSVMTVSVINQSQNNQVLEQSQNISNQQNQEKQHLQTIDITDINNWQTFSNDEQNYIIKYPQGYKVQRYDSPCSSRLNNDNGQNVIILLDNSINKNDEAYTDDVQNGKIATFEIFINDPNDKCIRNGYSSVSGPIAQNPKLLNSENTVINGMAVLKRNYAHLTPEGDESNFRFSTWRFVSGNKHYTLMYNNGKKMTNSKLQEQLFVKFLENFQIIKN